VKVADRIPIKPIARGDELQFNHLVMDCIGPIIPDVDPIGVKPGYNYALVLVDKFSRWPMAYPLRSLSAKATCDALLQVFMTFAIPKVISSDCGANFTAQVTKEMLKRLGCSPRFNTPGHPEAAGLVERCNQSLKRMIYKLAQENPREWHKLLPFVLWALREKPNATTHISPYTLVYGMLPKGPLSVLKESWAGQRELPLNIGKSPEEYLQTLKENLEIAKAYADLHAQNEQENYAHYYNTRSKDRHFAVGDKVLVLAPEGSKLYSRWHGPGTVIQVKSPYSYIVQVEGRNRHLHANKIRKYHDRIDTAIVDNCAVIYDSDYEFGYIDTIEVTDQVELPSQLIDRELLSHLSEEQKCQLLDILDKYQTVFSDKPGFISGVEHEIRVTSEFVPKRLRPYKVPEIIKEEVSNQIQEMLRLGIIRPSNSEMASPLVCVMKGHKGQNKVRLAIDFRYVNKHSAGDAYPSPDLSDVMEKVSRATYISCFDAKSGYWQIAMKEEYKWLTAFSCDEGLFEFNRMPFGLKSAGNTFIRALSNILKQVKSFTEPFVDDMAVCSTEWWQHLGHLDRYLDTMQDAGITLNLKKCTFARSSVKFVGHLIGSGMKRVDPDKVQCVHEIKAPSTKREVRRLIGFFSYFRSFIPKFAELSRCLTDLTKKGVPDRTPWDSSCQEALDKLKEALVNAVCLFSVDFSRDFGLLVDASINTVGCCLVQLHEGKEFPVAFASAKLSETQTRWSTIEREAYAVVWALKKFRAWLLFSKVYVYSDHNPLKYLTESVPKSSKLTRWALALQEFNLCFNYRPAEQHQAADYLSRI
jgi:transposase InsO family protein